MSTTDLSVDLSVDRYVLRYSIHSIGRRCRRRKAPRMESRCREKGQPLSSILGDVSGPMYMHCRNRLPLDAEFMRINDAELAAVVDDSLDQSLFAVLDEHAIFYGDNLRYKAQSI